MKRMIPTSPALSTPALDAEKEICCRADEYLNQRVLVVDYYRIRRKFAFPLALEEPPVPPAEVPGIAVYPWATWYSWALEERIFCLGWAAQWTGRAGYSRAAARDLEMLANWQNYRQFESPDLCMAHFSRTLWAARSRWNWLSEELQTKTDAALMRIVDDVLPLHCAIYGETFSPEKILKHDEPRFFFQNIRVIGSIGAALAAQFADRPEARGVLQRNLKVLALTLLEMRERGLSEGVSYNGYVLDFLSDWMTTLPQAEREEILSDARWSTFFEESLHTSVPGDLLQVAPMGDVEPEEMPFHISAQAKLHNLQSTPRPREYSARDWYLRRLNPRDLRADALAALRELPPESSASTPAFGASDAHYAVSLRSGWEKRDVAVVVAASNSPLGHIPANYGSLCLGTEGKWFIQTPGYQQYIPNSEREFTVGKAACNTPLIDNYGVSVKAGRVLQRRENKSSSNAVFDLTACYTPAIELQSLVRSVHLVAHEEVTTVLVEDRIEPGNWENVAYYWHGNPDAAWWVQDGFAMLYLNGRTLWISSPQAKIEFSDIQRLRGSRGQMTLVSRAAPDSDSSLIQWLFVFDERKPADLQAAIQQVKNQQ